MAYLEVADVSDHVCEERVAGNVERYTKTLQQENRDRKKSLA